MSEVTMMVDAAVVATAVTARQATGVASPICVIAVARTAGGIAVLAR